MQTTLTLICALLFTTKCINAQINTQPNGDVGIGTNNPRGLVDIWGGTLYVTGSSHNGTAVITSSNGTAYFSNNSVSNGLSISPGGHIGIGIANPLNKLDLGLTGTGGISLGTYNSAASGSIRFIGTTGSDGSFNGGNITGTDNGAAGMAIINTSAGVGNSQDVAFYSHLNGSQSSQKLIIKSDGNIGIGTVAPQSKLHIEGGKLVLNSSHGTFGQLQLTRNDDGETSIFMGAGVNGGLGGIVSGNDNSKLWILGPGAYTGNASDFNLGSINHTVPSFTINSNGNIGIGTTAPENSELWGRVLEIKGYYHSKSIVSTSGGVTSGLWSHDADYYNMTGSGVGTFTNHPFSVMTNKTPRLTFGANGTLKVHDFAGNGIRMVIADASGNLSTQAVPIGGSSSITLAGNSGQYQFNNNGTLGAGAIYEQNGNIAIGTNDPKGYRFAVNGDAIFTKVKVKSNSTWPDYVFDSAYHLAPLKEVEAYIQAYKHLPDIASAEAVEKEGLDVGANQAQLLKKIEELTLYIIEQDKRIKALENKQKGKRHH